MPERKVLHWKLRRLSKTRTNKLDETGTWKAKLPLELVLFSLEESLRSPKSLVSRFFTAYCVQLYPSSAFATRLLESFVSLSLVTTDVHVLLCEEGKKSSCFLAMEEAWL